jgi:Outer membrane protein beta-barrel domain
MKSFCLSVLLVLFTSTVFGQNLVGIFAGPQVTTSFYSLQDQKQKNKVKYGFNAGVMMKVPFEGNLYFAPAAMYSLKGYKVTYTQFSALPDVNAKNNNTTLHTFELAALLQFDLSTNPGHFFIKAGPSLDFQLIGKEKFDLLSGGSVKRNMKFSYGDYGHYSANMLGQFGYETRNSLLIFAQYTYGLASINNFDGGPNIRHRVFGISVGKYLDKKNSK